MARLAGNSGKWLEMAKNGLKWLAWLDTTGNGMNDWNLLEMA